MKVNQNFIAREIAGELVIIPTGEAASQSVGLITVNEVGVLIWKCLEREWDKTAILQTILNEFEIDEATAEADMNAFIDKLCKIGAVVENI